jgi:hypothetical protein
MRPNSINKREGRPGSAYKCATRHICTDDGQETRFRRCLLTYLKGTKMMAPHAFRKDTLVFLLPNLRNWRSGFWRPHCEQRRQGAQSAWWVFHLGAESYRHRVGGAAENLVLSLRLVPQFPLKEDGAIPSGRRNIFIPFFAVPGDRSEKKLRRCTTILTYGYIPLSLFLRFANVAKSRGRSLSSIRFQDSCRPKMSCPQLLVLWFILAWFGRDGTRTDTVLENIIAVISPFAFLGIYLLVRRCMPKPPRQARP